MKRITIIFAIVGVLFLTASIVVRARTRKEQGWRGHRWHQSGPMSYLAHELKLSDEQRGQIHTMCRKELPVIAAQVHVLLDENKEMNAIAAKTNPDQSAAREVAERQAKTIASLLVEKEQLQSKIYMTVLTPEQRLKADALRAQWESRFEHAAELLASAAK